MKNTKRIISLLLAFVLLFGMMPINAFAGEAEVLAFRAAVNEVFTQLQFDELTAQEDIDNALEKARIALDMYEALSDVDKEDRRTTGAKSVLDYKIRGYADQLVEEPEEPVEPVVELDIEIVTIPLIDGATNVTIGFKDAKKGDVIKILADGNEVGSFLLPWDGSTNSRGIALTTPLEEGQTVVAIIERAGEEVGRSSEVIVEAAPEVEKYTLSYTDATAKDADGNVIESGAEVEPGTEVTVTATRKDSKTYDGWNVEPADLKHSVSDLKNKVTFTMPEGNVVLSPP